MPGPIQRFVANRVFIGILFMLMAALQIRFAVLALEVISDPGRFPELPTIHTTTLKFFAPRKTLLAAGIKEGDLLLAIDGNLIPSRSAGARIILRHKPGDAIVLTVERDHNPPFTAKYVLGRAFRYKGWTFPIMIMLDIVTPWSCILLAFLVAFRRPEDPVTWPLFCLLICVSQAFQGYGDAPYAWPLVFSWPALFFDEFALPGMAVAWLWTAIQFPDPRSPSRVWPWSRWVFGIWLLVPYSIGACWFATAANAPKAVSWLQPINNIPRLVFRNLGVLQRSF